MFMFGQFLSLLSKCKSVSIDHVVFWFHYRVTVVLLTAAALVVTSQEFFGQPIACGPAPVNVPDTVLNYYCWTRSTYSLQVMREHHHHYDDYEQEEEAEGGAYPGLGTGTKNHKPVYHSYYQWVWIVLVIQAAFFYLPRFVWKRQERGRVVSLTARLDDWTSDEDLGKKVHVTANAVHALWNRCNRWAFAYFGCELLAFGNVVIQMFIVDRFLGGSFLTFGTDVLWYSYQEQEERTDPMVKVFPRLTKCSFRSFGASGSVQVHDALCVLPLNIINEKVYVLFWFWMVLLAIVTALFIVYRLILIFVPHFRRWVSRQFMSAESTYALKRLMSNSKVGDWLLIELLKKNLSEDVFDKVVVELKELMEMNGKTSRV